MVRYLKIVSQYQRNELQNKNNFKRSKNSDSCLKTKNHWERQEHPSEIKDQHALAFAIFLFVSWMLTRKLRGQPGYLK